MNCGNLSSGLNGILDKGLTNPGEAFEGFDNYCNWDNRKEERHVLAKKVYSEPWWNNDSLLVLFQFASTLQSEMHTQAANNKSYKNC